MLRRSGRQSMAITCVESGFDLVIAADEAAIDGAAAELGAHGGNVQAVQTDLATTEGVDKLCAAIGSRPVDALLANAGIGLGKAFLDQDFHGSDVWSIPTSRERCT
jgi:short-subunit dehydrogenase